MPLLRETMTLIPVSTNGTEKSTTSDLSSLIVSEPMAMSARLYTTWKGQQQQWERNLIMANSCNCSQQTKPIFHSPPPFFSPSKTLHLDPLYSQAWGEWVFQRNTIIEHAFPVHLFSIQNERGPVSSLPPSRKTWKPLCLLIVQAKC